jgi:uncharacterized membrane protein
VAIFPTQGRPNLYIGRIVVGRPRLFIAIAVAIASFFVEPAALPLVTRLLLAWNIGTWLYIALYLYMIATSDEKAIRWRAKITDDGQFAILIMTSLAAVASMAAIFAELSITKDLKGLEKEWHLILAGVTIVSAWVFIHLTFALHYAHEYFDETKELEGETPKVQGGINFPDCNNPDYWDFLYFSFIIGVASQTADVSIGSKVIRRTSLVHSILAFFFNSAILALTINIAASLI